MPGEVVVVTPGATEPETPIANAPASLTEVIEAVEQIQELAAPVNESIEAKLDRVLAEQVETNAELKRVSDELAAIKSSVQTVEALEVAEVVEEIIEEEQEPETVLVPEEIPSVVDVQEAVPEFVEQRQARKRYFL